MTRDDFYVGQEVYILSDQSTQVWTINDKSKTHCKVCRVAESFYNIPTLETRFVPYSDIMPAVNKPLIAAIQKRQEEVLARALQAPAIGPEMFQTGDQVYIKSDCENRKWIVTNAQSHDEGGCYVFRHIEKSGLVAKGFIVFRFVLFSDLEKVYSEENLVEALSKLASSENESWGYCTNECAYEEDECVDEDECVAEKEFDLGSVVILRSDCKKYEDQRSYWTVESKYNDLGDYNLVQINAHGEFKKIIINEKAFQAV